MSASVKSQIDINVFERIAITNSAILFVIIMSLLLSKAVFSILIPTV
ncbi:MAG: hypothetical protein WCX23_01095 [Candidatus Paceibacterota bacterium]|nr:hypothetical protein [Candidatus Paceibacterota bacterium]MDD4830646.1 hypothetical protein [Candidatus Paceibacterota bacterium]